MPEQTLDTADPHVPSVGRFPRAYEGDTAWQRAEDLFDYPPRERKPCLACWQTCEHYSAGRCWLCVMTDQYPATS